jgi:hypothetical protein
MDLRVADRKVRHAGLALIAVVCLLFAHLAGTRLITPRTYPLLAVVVSYALTAFRFIDIITGGGHERAFYRVAPLDLHRVVLAKNLSAMLTFFTLLVPTLAVEMFVFNSTLAWIGRGGLYAATSLFVMIHAGNLISCRRPQRSERKGTNALPFVEAGVIVAASLPYWVLVTLFSGPMLCLMFTLLSGLSWYFFSIPATAGMLQRNNDDLIDDERA